MHGYARIEQELDDASSIPKILWEGRFDIAEHDVIYAAHAFLKAYFPTDEGLDPDDVRLYVWPFSMREDPTGEEFSYEDAIYRISGNLLIAADDLDRGEGNPYPLVVKLLRMGALTEFSSSDQLIVDTLKVVTFFYYGCPGWGGSTTGGDTEQFLWRMNALEEGWDAHEAATAAQSKNEER